MKKSFFIFLFLMMAAIAGCEKNLQKPVFEYAISNPAGNGSRFPNFYQDETGTIYMSWIANVEEDIFMFRYSRYVDEGWLAPETIHLGTDYFSHWADFASVVGTEGDAIAAHRFKRTENSLHAYQAELLIREPATGRWENLIAPMTGQIPSRHGFVSMELLSENSILAVWLDGGNAEELAYSDVNKTTDGLAALRSAIISADGEISMSQVIDETVCECCKNDLVATEEGYTVVYKSRDAGDGGIRDVRITHFDAESGEWSTPELVYREEDSRMQMEGCPADGPRMDVNRNYKAVVWYAKADGSTRVNLARSTGSEEGFQDVITVAETEQQPLGRADVLVTDSGGIYVSWLRQTGENADIMLTYVDAEGSVQESHRIGTTAAGNNSGFPRMAESDDAIIIAWTQTAPVFRVRTGRFPL